MRRVMLSNIFLFTLTVLFLSSSSSWALIYISNINDLQKIGNDAGYPLNGEYELTQDIDASDTVNWNSGAGFAPIGTLSNRFTGKFDGKGYKITGLYINRPPMSYVGLFGYIGSGSELKNLGIVNCQIVGDSCVGGLVGSNDGGEVSGSYSTGSVSGSYAVGGLVGVNSGTISGSYSTGSVSSNRYTGGLVGYNYGTVSGSYSTGSVSDGEYIGGLVGVNDGGEVSGSYSTGSVSGSYAVGGLVGGNLGSVSNSYARVSVMGTGQYIGGLIGFLYSSNITNTYSMGAVVGSGSDKGGLIGYSTGTATLTSSYWDTQTSGMNTSADGTGKTTAEMKQQVTYVGWDFTNIWGIVEGWSYPYLLWQGEPLVTIPDVVGMTQAEAESAITGVELSVGTVSQQCSETVPAGEVISQVPSVGQQVSPGTAVNIVISTGPCPVMIPNVVGLTQSNAESAITGAGLTVGMIAPQCSDTVPAGSVISQDPSAGEEVPPGTAVNLVVSTGPCLRVVVNQPSEVVKQTGESIEFKVTVEGGSGTINYQWYYDAESGGKSGQPIPGENGDTLVLTDLEIEDTGWYWCQVSDDYEVVETEHVHLIVEKGLDLTSSYMIAMIVFLMVVFAVYRMKKEMSHSENR